MGRPSIPKSLAKGVLLSVRFSGAERRILERAAEREGTSLSEWARRTLLAAVNDATSPLVTRPKTS